MSQERYKPLFRRIAEENDEIPDIWKYDDLPLNVRIQIWQISSNHHLRFYEICETLRHEIGVTKLAEDCWYRDFSNEWDYAEELRKFFMRGLSDKSDVENARYALSVVEMLCIKLSENLATAATDDINYRLRCARIGWIFNADSNRMIKIDSEIAYEMSIKPAFYLLSRAGFQETTRLFSMAFDNYQTGDFENAINSAIRALESTLRNICVAKSFPFHPQRETLGGLMKVLIDNNYLSQYQEDYANNLAKLLIASGTIRNRKTGHGKADEEAAKEQESLDENLVQFVLSQTASAIVFLVTIFDE